MAGPVLGLIGGSGLGQAFADSLEGEPMFVSTPFGQPSAAILCGTWHGVEIAFLARHGTGHTIPPGAVPYRANLWALKSLGVTHILASGATGSLREEIRPRDLVIPDQVIDRTTRRAVSFFDEVGVAVHVEFGEPFCPTLRKHLLAVGETCESTVHDGGTYVCMEGPAFSTVAESRMHRAAGGDLIGMTCMPEAKLAREAEICYALVALPTDYDSWRPRDPSQSTRELMKEILENMEQATQASVKLIEAAMGEFARGGLGDCPCQSALRPAIWTQRENISTSTINRLGILLQRYLQPNQS